MRDPSTAPLAWRQPAWGWVTGFIALQSALVWVVGEDEAVLGAGAALGAALASLAALAVQARRLRRGAGLSRWGIAGHFTLAGAIAGLVLPPLLGAAAVLFTMPEAEPQLAWAFGLVGVMIAPTVGLFGVALGLLSGTAAAWILFRRDET